jgi:hypothetical protein
MQLKNRLKLSEMKNYILEQALFEAAARGRARASTWLPKHDGAKVRKVETPKGLDIYTFYYPTGKPGGVAFQGRAQKPLWNYMFRDEAQRDKEVTRTITSYQNAQKSKADAAAAKKAFQHSFQVGDFLYSSWGYDQTNVDFYQVIKVPSPKSIVVREVGKKIVRESGTSEYVVPRPNAFVSDSKAKTARVSVGNSIKMGSRYASKWDGKPKYQTAFGYGH